MARPVSRSPHTTLTTPGGRNSAQISASNVVVTGVGGAGEGTTGLGAGLPGGDGVILDNCHPRHLDWVAAHNPELKIVAARPGWPWQAEVIAVLMHKRNIWYELHGWSPKYHTADLKHEIPRRLKDRILFGGDYPLFTYERLVKDWRAEGYPEEILERVFHKNAQRFLAEMGVEGTV